jgi:plastocyanin
MMSSTDKDAATSAAAVSENDGASSENKNFYLFTTEIEGVNETKLGLSGDVFSLQTMVVNKGDNVTVHFFNLEKDKSERHSFTIGAPYNINKDLAGGENATISFVADQKGIFQYHCIYHPPEMIGQLVVLPTTAHRVNTNVQVEIQPQVSQIVTHITKLNPQVNEVNIKQVIIQLALQVVNNGGNGSQVVNQIANQVATEKGDGNVSQFINQLAVQQASGNTQNVNQTITQIAKQVANGNEDNVVQVITQMANQEMTSTSSVVPSPRTNQTTTQGSNQTTTTTPSVNGGNQTSANNAASTNPLSYLAKLFGFK